MNKIYPLETTNHQIGEIEDWKVRTYENENSFGDRRRKITRRSFFGSSKSGFVTLEGAVDDNWKADKLLLHAEHYDIQIYTRGKLPVRLEYTIRNEEETGDIRVKQLFEQLNLEHSDIDNRLE